MTVETEIKLPLESALHGKRLLKRAGFRPRKRRALEQNTLFDTERGNLRRAGTALRIRQSRGRVILTYKGPLRPGKHKSREELEIEIGDAAQGARILARLGFGPVFSYRKFRTEYAGADSKGIICLDETPAGCFLELEGPPRWIERTRRALGFRASDAITASYIQLYTDASIGAGAVLSGMV
ncbi:MAG: class IV adenylate cyclase [Candidatus Solibacter usitatus]|nr:class IV adenylate cyclase [Candidatus Solibacter usitatus]